LIEEECPSILNGAVGEGRNIGLVLAAVLVAVLIIFVLMYHFLRNPNNDVHAKVVQDVVGDELQALILIEASQVEVVQNTIIPIAEPVDVEDIPYGIFGAVQAEILQDL